MKFYKDMPKHNFKQQAIANDCWETIATGRPSWHVSNLRRDGFCKGKKLSYMEDQVCKHKTSRLPHGKESSLISHKIQLDVSSNSITIKQE